MLAADTNNPRPQIAERISPDLDTRRYSNYLTCPCLFVIMCESTAVRFPVREFPKSFSQSELRN
jgi:hypothetical protein